MRELLVTTKAVLIYLNMDSPLFIFFKKRPFSSLYFYKTYSVQV